ncbi:MAG: SDR family NAD(P)-dependent oxidoreductase [Thermoleophilaceae bacterium]
MELGLNGKLAVVTGASRGIGAAVMSAFEAEGVRVVGGSRSGPVKIDLSTPEGPGELIEQAVAELGGLDILVNNVGEGVMRPDPFAVSDDEWRDTLELNLMSAVRACRAAIPVMLARGGGAIVTVSSVNAFLPEPSAIDYSAAKAALVSFSKSLALRYAAEGVRVNVVSPGVTATRPRGRDEIEAVEADVPMRRMLDPDEVARLVVLVASGAASGMTGADVVVDGGLAPNT